MTLTLVLDASKCRKRDLELRLSAAQFALKRWPKRHQALAAFCDVCAVSCQTSDLACIRFIPEAMCEKETKSDYKLQNFEE